MSAARGARPVDLRREMPDRDTRDRRRPERRDRTAIEDRGRRIPSSASLMTTTALIAGSPSSLFVANPATHFIPIRSPNRPVGAAQVGRHGVHERALRPRVDTDLGRQLGIGDESGHGPLGQRQALVDSRASPPGRPPRRGSGAAADRVPATVTRPRVYAATMAYDVAVPPIDVEQSLDNLKLERDAIVLYDALSAIEKDPRRAAAFERIAGNERRHADIWASKLRDLGADVPAPDGPRMRVRFIILAARLLGTAAVADLVKALEGDEENAYDAQAASPEVAAIAADEREHAVIWDQLKGGTVDPDAIDPTRDGVAIARACPQPRPRSASTRRGTGPAAGRGRSGRSSSGSATAWSATSRW